MPNWKSIKRKNEIENGKHYFVTFKDGSGKIITLPNINIEENIIGFKKVIFPDSPTPEDLENDERDFETETLREVSEIHKSIIKEMSRECKDNQKLCLWDNKIKHLENLIK